MGEQAAGGAEGRWPETDAHRVPDKVSAAAGLSLGVFLLALESERLSAVVEVSKATSLPALATLLSLAILGICVALLCHRPPRRPAPAALAFAAALACSFGLACEFCLEGTGAPVALLVVGDVLRSIAPPVLLFCWIQRTAPFGRPFAIRSFGVGAVTLGALSMLTVALAHVAAVALIVALPPVGAALLLCVNPDEVPGNEPGARWNALQAIAQEGARGGGQSGRDGIAHQLGRAFVKLAPFMCYAIIFGNVHFSWLDLQDGGSVSTWVQLGAATGAIICGFAALGLARLRLGRAFESLMHLLLTALAIMALWLCTFLTSGFVFAYLVLLNIAQKLMLLLIVLFGFAFARDERTCASLWALAFFSFHLGTAVSYFVGTLHVAEIANIAAAVALGVICVAEVADIASLYGVRPAMGNGRADEMTGEAADGGAAPTGAENTPLATDPSNGAQQAEVAERCRGCSAADQAAGCPAHTDANGGETEPATGGFDAEEYACHLIASEYDLTRREEEILRLLVRGRSAARIGEALCVTTATARTHLRNIYAKLGVHSQQDILDLFEDYRAGRA